jgi:nucleotide-binding universal stress UspA family protein
MLRSILIGVDTTESSIAAERLGVRLARRSGATLLGLAIVDQPGIQAIEPAWPVGGDPKSGAAYYMGYGLRLATVQENAQRALDQFASRCKEQGVAHVEVKRVGSPHEEIQQEAQTCDLIVMAKGSQFRFITGDDEADDTLKRVLKDTPRPVVIVPATASEEGPVVIAYDGSLQAARALASFEATGLGEGADVHIISVGASLSEAAEHARRCRTFLSYHKIESIAHASSSSGPAEVILDQVRRLRAGLLVMGAYGQPVLREFFIGSVTRTLLNESPVPIFCFH